MIDYNLLYVIGGILSAGFCFGLRMRKQHTADVLELLVTLAFFYLLSWVGVIGLVVSLVREK